MKQSTLFSMVGNASAQQKLLSPKPSSTLTTNKENVEVKVGDDDDDVCVELKENDFNIDTAPTDSKLKLSNNNNQSSDSVSDTQFGMSEKKEVISYQDFISDNKTKSTPGSKSTKVKDDSLDSCLTYEETETVNSKPINLAKSTSHLLSKGGNAPDHAAKDLMTNGNMSKEESDKQSMSYKDFIGMFKPASVSGSVEVDASDGKEIVDKESTKDDKLEVNESVGPTKKVMHCKSITSFFKPVSKTKNVPGSKKTEESSTFTVTADVHIVPSLESDGESPQKRLRTDVKQTDSAKKRPSNAVTKKNHCDVDEIVLISSTVVNSSLSETGAKKRKFDNGDTNKESRLGLQPKKKKPSGAASQSQDDHLDKGGSKPNVKSLPESGQCKLSFGASGLTIAKEKMKPVVEENEPVEVVADCSDDVKKVTAETSGEVANKCETKKSSSKRLKLKSSAKVTQCGENGGGVDHESSEKQLKLDDSKDCAEGMPCVGSDGTADIVSKKRKRSTAASKDDNLDKEDNKLINTNTAKAKSPPESSQSKLSFGASGLTITKEKPKQVVENENDTGEVLTKDSFKVAVESESETPDDNKVNSNTRRSCRKRLKLKTSSKVDRCDTDESEVDTEIGAKQPSMLDSASSISNDSVDCVVEVEACQDEPDGAGDKATTTTEARKSGRLRLRPSKAAELKEKSESQINNETEKVEKKKIECNKSTPVKVVAEEASSPGLRRSSRIRHHVESAKKEEVDVIELDSDECESERKAARKGGREKQKKSAAKLAEQVSEKSDESRSSKVPRKLAPIFTRLKQAQPEVVQPPPPPTPEELAKLQARRDFLSSGIPDELKRAKAALDLQMLPEYPPFPRPSHVCQIDESSAASCSSGDNVNFERRLMRRMSLDSNVGEVRGLSLKWDDLGWSKFVAKQSEECRKLLFLDFSSHPSLNRGQVEMLIQEFQGRDRTFPFKETLDSLTAVKDATQAKETSMSTNEVDIIVVDDATPPRSNNRAVVYAKSSLNNNGTLWTDEHPMSSKHFVGNSKSLKQLSEWLRQWQDELRKDAKKAMRGGKSGKDTQKKAAQDWSEDSDFTDSSEEDCGLCNTMLVTGPHGVGKTSIVYCLAKEMGFKVFEVNPTSLRSGKQLQSQLEEATQSHRVSHSSNPSSGQFGTPPPGTLKPKPPQEPVRPVAKPPACKAFSAFFKPSNNNSVKSTLKNKEGKKSSEVTEDKRKKKESKKKSVEVNPSPKIEKKRGRKRKDEGKAKEDEPEKGVSSGDISSNPLNITSSSIILFDEADVVLEEDKGFLSTVQHFMSSTKIPIIITATHPAIHSELSPRHEHIVLKRPPVKTLSSFLHTVCLARGLRVGHQSLTHLVSALNQDIRQCLLRLQFWCESGGGRSLVKSDSLVHQNLSSKPHPSADTNVLVDVACGESVPNSDNNSNDSDFLSLRPARKRQRRMCAIDDDDDDSNSNSNIFKAKPVEEKCDKPMGEAGSGGGDGNADSVSLPLIHTGCDTSLIGGHDLDGSTESVITDLIKEQVLDLNRAVVKIIHFEGHLPYNLIYITALHCCSLTKIDPLPVRLEVEVEAPKNEELPQKRRRRIMVGDWLDSDGSDDDDDDNGGSKSKGGEKNVEDVAESEKAPFSGEAQVQSDSEKVENCVETKHLENVIVNSEGSDNNDIAVKDLPLSKEKKSAFLTSTLLQALSRFYENNSSVQCLYSTTGLFERDRDEKCLLPGVSDEEILKVDKEFDSNRVLSQEICGCVDLLSARMLVQGVDACLDREQSGTKMEDGGDVINSSMEEEMNSLPIGFQVPDVWTLEKNIEDVSQEASTKNISSCVGSGGSGSRSPLHLDYMPVLRQMCRFEHERQTTNAKRRFNHYFDYVGLNVRESTRVSLASTYSISRR